MHETRKAGREEGVEKKRGEKTEGLVMPRLVITKTSTVQHTVPVPGLRYARVLPSMDRGQAHPQPGANRPIPSWPLSTAAVRLWHQTAHRLWRRGH